MIDFFKIIYFYVHCCLLACMSVLTFTCQILDLRVVCCHVDAKN